MTQHSVEIFLAIALSKPAVTAATPLIPVALTNCCCCPFGA